MFCLPGEDSGLWSQVLVGCGGGAVVADADAVFRIGVIKIPAGRTNPGCLFRICINTERLRHSVALRHNPQYENIATQVRLVGIEPLIDISFGKQLFEGTISLLMIDDVLGSCHLDCVKRSDGSRLIRLRTLLWYVGTTIATKIPIMPMTISNSISVKPRPRSAGAGLCFMVHLPWFLSRRTRIQVPEINPSDVQ